MPKSYKKYYDTILMCADQERLEQFEQSILMSFKAEPTLLNHFFAETISKEKNKIIIRVWGDMPLIRQKYEDSKKACKKWSYKVILRKFKVDIGFSELFNSPIENN